jgi:hypothetical protein
MDAHASNRYGSPQDTFAPSDPRRGGLTLHFAAAYPGQEACPFSGRYFLSDPSDMTIGGPVRRLSTRRADQ